MRPCKNLIDARSSTLKKYVFVSVYSTTGVHGTKKKFSRILPSPKKYYFRFCLQYYAWDFENKFNRHLPSTAKKNPFLTTVLLWCMGLGKNSITFNIRKKKHFHWIQYFCCT